MQRARKTRRAIACFALLAAASCLLNCVSVPQSNYATPESSVDAMQQAMRDDDVGTWLGTLAIPTRRKHETLILQGWSSVRDALSFLQGNVEIAEVQMLESFALSDEKATDSNWVWPDADAPVARVRVVVEIDNEKLFEDFLFIKEVDPAPSNSSGSPWVRVGLRDEATAMHPDPEEVQVDESPEETRINWRLIYPYYPYQSVSKLAPKLTQTLTGETESAPAGE